jgi:rRNA maturation RNase YbeY
MFSLGYLIIAVIDIAVLVWAMKLYKQYPSTALMLATMPLTLMWFDNLTIGLGSTFGEGPLLLGDVLLARETLAREAREQGKRPADHFCHLVVHGVLHLLGQDHGSETEARVMERLEVAALGRLGVADPYAAAVVG